MLKRILVAALWLPLIALAQSYPSPTFNNVTVRGTLSVTGAPTFAAPVPISSGGTGQTTAAAAAHALNLGTTDTPTFYGFTINGSTAHGVTIGQGNGSPTTWTAAGNAGQPLLSGGASADPSYGTLGVGAGGTGATSLAQYNVLAGNGTSAISAIAPSTSGFVLTSNGASAFPTFQALPSGRLIGVQVFTSSGTYTPTTGTSSVIVEVQAPGGGGGAVSATGSGQVALAQPGSGGSYAKARVTSGFSGATVTIGSTGTGGAAGTNAGTTGGTTSFGTFVSCPGGNGGAGSAAVSPPAGQSPAAVPSACTVTSATTLVSTSGGQGTGAWALSATTAFVGEGGASLMGPGSGTGSGSGGNSAAIAQSVAATAGSNASAGKIIVYEYN